MKTDLEKAYKILNDEEYTCVLCRDEKILTSRERGVKPLLEWIESGEDFKGFYAADKVVGKAAAFLYVIMGIDGIYAKVISDAAKAVFDENGIEVFFDTSVPAIRNRTDTGFCPMETAVAKINSPEDALDAIKEKLKNLSKV